MKRLLFSIIATLCISLAHADTYPYLTFVTADGGQQSVGVESLTMTIADGKLIVNNGSESQEFALSSLVSMSFTSTSATAIEGITVNGGDTLGNGPIKVYTPTGTALGTYGSVSLFISNAPKGVYIVKSNGKTQKIMIR